MRCIRIVISKNDKNVRKKLIQSISVDDVKPIDWLYDRLKMVHFHCIFVYVYSHQLSNQLFWQLMNLTTFLWYAPVLCPFFGVNWHWQWLKTKKKLQSTQIEIDDKLYNTNRTIDVDICCCCRVISKCLCILCMHVCIIDS